MVTEQLSGELAKYGCKPIQSIGTEFDPNIHEAIAQVPSDEFAAGVVAQELAVGYLLHDRVVRPSNVIVSSGPAANES
jgi:molecular chaperone GrpE